MKEIKKPKMVKRYKRIRALIDYYGIAFFSFAVCLMTTGMLYESNHNTLSIVFAVMAFISLLILGTGVCLENEEQYESYSKYCIYHAKKTKRSDMKWLR